MYGAIQDLFCFHPPPAPCSVGNLDEACFCGVPRSCFSYARKNQTFLEGGGGGGKGDGLSIASDDYSKLRSTTGPVVESVCVSRFHDVMTCYFDGACFFALLSVLYVCVCVYVTYLPAVGKTTCEKGVEIMTCLFVFFSVDESVSSAPPPLR